MIFVDSQGGDFPQTLEDAGQLHKVMINHIERDDIWETNVINTRLQWRALLIKNPLVRFIKSIDLLQCGMNQGTSALRRNNSIVKKIPQTLCGRTAAGPLPSNG